MKKDLDTLLEIHFNRRHANVSRLEGMEQVILGHIKRKRSTFLKSWTEETLSVFTAPQFCFAALGLALLIGLATSFTLPFMRPSSGMTVIQETGINMFATNFSYLPSSRFRLSVVNK